MGRATGHAETRKSLSTNGLRTGTPNQLRQQQRWTCLTLGYRAYPRSTTPERTGSQIRTDESTLNTEHNIWDSPASVNLVVRTTSRRPSHFQGCESLSDSYRWGRIWSNHVAAAGGVRHSGVSSGSVRGDCCGGACVVDGGCGDGRVGDEYGGHGVSSRA